MCVRSGKFARPLSNIARNVLLAAFGLAATVSVKATTYTAVDLYTASTAPGGFGKPNQSFTTHSADAAGFVATATAQYSPPPGQNPPGQKTAAFLYVSPTGQFTNLTPSTLFSATVDAISGSQQAGAGQAVVNGPTHAMAWAGTAASATDLNPVGYQQSTLFGTTGSQQVGWGIPNGANGVIHAMVWNGTAASAVDLDPGSPYDYSLASAAGGGKQVGQGVIGVIGHALLWSGSAASTVDLHPGGVYTSSNAYGTDGIQEVGLASVDFQAPGQNGAVHAMLWSGSAASAVDLEPTAGFYDSTALDVVGNVQVGFGDGPSTNLSDHALLWTGTADSVVDLGALLPATLKFSHATSLDAAGNVYGFAFDGSGQIHAVEWIATPEPTTAGFIGTAACLLIGRRRRSKRDDRRR